MADPIGEQNVVVTEPILALPGDEIMWRLAEPLRTHTTELIRSNDLLLERGGKWGK